MKWWWQRDTFPQQQDIDLADKIISDMKQVNAILREILYELRRINASRK